MILITKKEIVFRTVLWALLVFILFNIYALFDSSYDVSLFIEKIRYMFILFIGALFLFYSYLRQNKYSAVYWIILFSLLFSFHSPISYAIIPFLIWKIFEKIYTNKSTFINQEITVSRKSSILFTMVYYFQSIVLVSSVFFVIHSLVLAFFDLDLSWLIVNIKEEEIWFNYQALFTNIIFDIKNVWLKSQFLVLYMSVLTFFAYIYWNMRYSWVFKKEWKRFLILYVCHAIYWFIFFLGEFLSMI